MTPIPKIHESERLVRRRREPNKLRRLWAYARSVGLYRLRLGALGRGSTIRRPLMIRNGHRIFIGSSSHIRDHARLEVVVRESEPPPSLEIGDHVLIEQSVHIVCSGHVRVGNNVALAARCAIVDTTHPLPGDVNGNVGYHILPGASYVEIGEGSMLGVGVVVLANVRIGANCVIGANAVVTRDIPANSVAMGVPARVTRTMRAKEREL